MATYGRWAELSWAPLGHRFFLTIGIASDRSDCLVVEGRRHAPAVASVTRAVLKNPGPLLPAERPDTAHFYAECARWRSHDVVSGSVYGHADMPARHTFCAPFTFDVRTARVRWGARTVSAKDLDQSC